MNQNDYKNNYIIISAKHYFGDLADLWFVKNRTVNFLTKNKKKKNERS